MHSLTPLPAELVDFYDDGENTRHFHFRLLKEPQKAVCEHQPHWQHTQTGQFFMLTVPSLGEAPFSFTEVPDENGHFRALIRRMGGVTSALFELEAGQILGVRGPFGVGWPMDEISNKRILVIGGGCGLAPLVSAVDLLIEQQNYTQLTLVYGARTRQAQMLNPERERWQHIIPVYNTIEEGLTNGSDNEYPGTPSDILPSVLDTFGELPEVVLLAGPEAMMYSIAEYLVAYGVSAQAIYLSIERRMHCAVGTCGHCYMGSQYACTDGPTFRWDQLPSH
ncbi:FAD/NAD(P)-binding protein [Photobacterium alginatilyticum]|uniref:Oxidoreductase n=1 Tax=Photobacterium alginatilyticum TaxID=1775171 RepID=A0ABW9YF95_9GAMM|nr:FAD/NAD(P)-binding protein [Photobacterium alginatilyticum]NBI51918.1 oxidoreductase [Photobacterium alginatilyticum]